MTFGYICDNGTGTLTIVKSAIHLLQLMSIIEKYYFDLSPKSPFSSTTNVLHTLIHVVDCCLTAFFVGKYIVAPPLSQLMTGGIQGTLLLVPLVFIPQ